MDLLISLALLVNVLELRDLELLGYALPHLGVVHLTLNHFFILGLQEALLGNTHLLFCQLVDFYVLEQDILPWAVDSFVCRDHCGPEGVEVPTTDERVVEFNSLFLHHLLCQLIVDVLTVERQEAFHLAKALFGLHGLVEKNNLRLGMRYRLGVLMNL